MRMRVHSNARVGRNRGLTMSGHSWLIPLMSEMPFSFSLSAGAISP